MYDERQTTVDFENVPAHVENITRSNKTEFDGQ